MLAQTEAIYGEGQQRAEALQGQGRYAESITSLQNTQLELGLQRQNYTDAFRGQQVDPRLQAITYRPERNQDDPTKILFNIDTKMSELMTRIQELLED